MLSRSLVARFVASNIVTKKDLDRSNLVEQMAAWLVDTKQARRSQYLLGDVSWHLQQKGYIVATVKTARTLDEPTRIRVIDFIKLQYEQNVTVELIEQIDESLIGGLVITTASGVYDVSVLQKLKNFSKGVK
ncbi:MAG: F0F1 ATP synthase subunit delta [Patescibacteria group bacterium]|jgi:hypothetical protein|nr:F0F1 ATP synthase subunit delta [Patescibacteria group bacterium]